MSHRACQSGATLRRPPGRRGASAAWFGRGLVWEREDTSFGVCRLPATGVSAIVWDLDSSERKPSLLLFTSGSEP